MWMAARASGWGFSMACPGGLQTCLPGPSVWELMPCIKSYKK